MAGLTKKLSIAATVAVGISAIGSAPAFAASLSNIQFDTDDFLTYDYANITNGNEAAAISALTDDDYFTNVELFASSENVTGNYGFSGMLGGRSVSVQSVTSADWAVFGTQWAADFAQAYPGLNSLMPNLGSQIVAMGGLPRANDPNIGSFTQDDTTGEYSLDLIGHYNLLSVPHIQQMLGTQGTAMISAVLGGNPLQISEVAKVTIDGAVNYAYSFSATNTGRVAADDGLSHSGRYTWTKAAVPPVASVPEPSTMLGLMALGGVFATVKRKSAKNA